MSLSAILILSILFQLAAALSALGLMKLTGPRASWILISSALLMMCLRRVISLVDVAPNTIIDFSYANEIIGLTLSACMLFGVLGISSIFKERALAEQKVRDLLLEKERMLKEVHHRIKNNLCVIQSLLNIEADKEGAEVGKNRLVDAAGRVESMALLYDKLYRSGTFTDLSLKEYLCPLATEIMTIFPRNGEVTLHCDIVDIAIGAGKLSPLGLIINELMTNAMKYAFPNRGDHAISITASMKGGRVCLTVADNGIGFPESVALGDSKGFGLQLVEMLVKQIGGSISIGRGEGTKITIDFDPN